MVLFSDVRCVSKPSISVSDGSRGLYINLENGVGVRLSGKYLKTVEKRGWKLPKENHPDWQIFETETKTSDQMLLKLLSDSEERNVLNDPVGGKKTDEK